MSEPTAPAPADIDQVLHMFQADLPVLKKDRDGQVGNQKTKYADLKQANEVVLTRLNALGCIWVCEPTMIHLGDQLRFVLCWELKHVPSDTARRGQFPILGDSPMKLGSAITYARRYSLLAVTGVIPEDEDDDGQSFEEGHAVARRAASGRAQRAARPAQARGERVSPPVRSGRAGPPLPGEDQAPAADAPPDVHPDTRASVDQRQMRKMHALWGELVKLGQTQYAGDAGRDERLSMTARLAGRETLDTSSDLSFAEADRVIQRLEGRRDQLKAAAAPPADDAEPPL